MVGIIGVQPLSYAGGAGILPGDILVSVNGKEINDILDYRFYITDKKTVLEVLRAGKKLFFKIKKPEYSDLGLEFSSYLMDEKKRCKNNCVFCFIDQNPPGMRETVYFKDDDERLSFLQGNYITLTNLSERDISRIIEMRFSPVNISVHTVNPSLRVRMTRNKNAGECLKYLGILDKAGIVLNAQLVLCRGINDGAELKRSLEELSALQNICSVAAVPCGITGYRRNLTEITHFDKKSAAEVLDITYARGEANIRTRGKRLVYAADEFYLLAEKEIPRRDYYDDYPQIENGVGMLRSHREEFLLALENITECGYNRKITVATGEAAFAHISGLAEETKKKFPRADITVCAVKNNFFGGHITVSGLVTGGDIIGRLKNGEKIDLLLISGNMLRYDGDLFLDGVSVRDVETALGAEVKVIGNDGADLLYAFAGQ